MEGVKDGPDVEGKLNFLTPTNCPRPAANFATPVVVTDRCKTRRSNSLALRRRRDGTDQRLRSTHLGNRLPTPQRRLTANQPTAQPTERWLHVYSYGRNAAGWLVVGYMYIPTGGSGVSADKLGNPN